MDTRVVRLRGSTFSGKLWPLALGPLDLSCPTLAACGGKSRSCTKAAVSNRSKAAAYSITSSAAASSVGGTVRLSILAVSALMTSSILLACTTGRSAGLAPLRMRPA